ncbi:MAG: SpoIIE family protein phosphatase [bacterium]|nr:SpoIIE family protein phosphatase [bacterium]
MTNLLLEVVPSFEQVLTFVRDHTTYRGWEIYHVTLALAGITLLLLWRRTRQALREERRLRRRLASTNESVLNLLGKATESLQNTLDLSAFLHFYTDYSARSLCAQSAAFFRYQPSDRTVHAEAIVGAFPSVFNAPQDLLDSLLQNPQRLLAYLHDTHFLLTETPFVEAITQRRPLLFNPQEVSQRLHYTVTECWGLLVVPLIANSAPFGVLALTNKMDRSPFNLDDLHLAQSLSDMAGIAISHLLLFRELQEKQQIDMQLRTAELILAHLLPQRIPQDPRYELAVHYEFAYRLGGDYYDFVELDERHLGIIMADVSGKGIPAGLVMATTRSLFAVLSPGQLSPSTVLRVLNTHLLKLIPDDMFVTAIYAILDKQTGLLTYARAGHEPLLSCCPRSSPQCLGRTSGTVVGMLPDESFRQTLSDEQYYIRPGETVLFYTDGLTEAHNPHGEEFGRQRVAAVLQQVCALGADEAVRCIVHRVKKFMSDTPLYDDMTILAIKAR